MFTLRPYQKQAVDAVYDYLRNKDGNPCVVIPTGGGKTHVLSQICRDAVDLWDGRVLIVTHVKELVEQNAGKVMAYLDQDLVGIYSAGLKRRDTDHPVIAATIQSIYKRACELGPFDLVIVDEAHLISPNSESRYQQFFRDAKTVSPHLRIIGMTATPFRMESGLICGPDNILNEICYEAGVKELIVQGYLCPLRSKATRYKVDTSGLHIKGGEFISSQVEQLMDDEQLVQAACGEIVKLAADRKSVLIFASGVNHGMHIQRVLWEKYKKECGFVCGQTLPFDRADTIERFKSGELKYLCNVNVLTTGFDAPNIDCIAMVRPTASPGLYAQVIGRGFRLHESKDDCLVLDFGGNIVRHGPVDDIRINSKGNKSSAGDSPVKECPECHELIHAAYSQCPQCGFIFESDRDINHEKQASTASVLSGQVQINEYEVKSVSYIYHIKRNAGPDDRPTMRVEYQVGFNEWISEWICFEHTGYARSKAEHWWRQRSNEPVPDTVAEALNMALNGMLAEPEKITVRSVSGEPFDRITDYVLGPVPSVYDESAERDDTELPEYAWAEDEIPF